MGSIFFWGMGRVFPKYEHPFFQGNKPWIILPWSFQDSIQKKKEVIIWADVYSTSNDTLMVGPWGENEKNLKYREEIVSKDRPLLVDLLKKYPDRKFIINIVSNTMNIDSQILSATQNMIQRKNISFQSEFDIVLRSMKETFADLPYGASQSDRLRFNTFKSIAPWEAGLLPATPFRGDFYFAPLTWRKISMIDAQIVNEIHRRQKHVIIGPLKTIEDLKRAKGLGADGFLFENESLFKNYTTLHVDR